jgi:hypothetical protein
MQQFQGNIFLEFETELLAVRNEYLAFGVMVITNE